LCTLVLLFGCSSEDDGGNCEVGGFQNSCDNLVGGGADNLGGGAATSGGAAASGGGAANGAAGGGAGSGSGFLDPASDLCANAQASASGLIPRVHLLLDGSCSMSTPYPSQAGQMSATQCTNDGNSRWGALRNALVGNNGILYQLEGSIEFGVSVFGTANGQCPLPIPGVGPSLGNAGAIDGLLPNGPPGQYTPAGAALDQVFSDHFSGANNDPDALGGTEILVFATDGEPNSCDDPTTNYQPSVDAANRIAAGGVRMYVISLAASSGEFHDHLQQLADIGSGVGSGTLYEPSTPEDLSAALTQLIGGAVGCDIALNGRIQMGMECLGTVKLNEEPLGCDDPNGWVLTDERHIRLQGSACQRFMDSGSAIVSAEFGCNVFRPD
jgi:hypothetical protein